VAGHQLVDGNKRLGWVATRLFYRMNGADVQPLPDEAFDTIVAVASGELRDVPAIASVLRLWRDASRRPSASRASNARRGSSNPDQFLTETVT
jgi:prophage maintenance system killer protein